MSRSLGKKMGFGLGLAALGLATGSSASCADNTQSLFIRQIQDPPLGDCTVKNDPTALTISQGTLDVALAHSYFVSALVGNQLLGRGDPKTIKAETARVKISGAEVRLVDGRGVERGFFTVQTNGIIDPTNSSDPGWGIATVQLIPATIGFGFVEQARTGQFVVTARFKVFGKTLGGTDVTSDEFQFPIVICYGCLLNFSGEISDALAGEPANCHKGVKPGDPKTFCELGINKVASCQYCPALNVCTLCSAFLPCPQGGDCIGDTTKAPGRCPPR